MQRTPLPASAGLDKANCFYTRIVACPTDTVNQFDGGPIVVR